MAYFNNSMYYREGLINEHQIPYIGLSQHLEYELSIADLNMPSFEKGSIKHISPFGFFNMFDYPVVTGVLNTETDEVFIPEYSDILNGSTYADSAKTPKDITEEKRPGLYDIVATGSMTAYFDGETWYNECQQLYREDHKPKYRLLYDAEEKV
jgi:hypothetical protein